MIACRVFPGAGHGPAPLASGYDPRSPANRRGDDAGAGNFVVYYGQDVGDGSAGITQTLNLCSRVDSRIPIIITATAL